MPSVALVVAMDRDGVIGAGGRLPWHLPGDLRRFRAVTMGHPIVMGRRTHESIGRALPGRHNIVVTRTPGFRAPGCTVVGSLEEALVRAGAAAEVMVIGGAALFAAALSLARRIHLTEVHAAVGGDVYFPAFDRSAWVEIAREDVDADEHNPLPMSFVTLERRTGWPGSSDERP